MIRISLSRMLLLVAAVVALSGASCPGSLTSPMVNPDLLALSNPVAAEDAFYVVLKRAKDYVDTGKVPPTLRDEFRASAREVWTGLEEWRATGDQTKYRQRWPDMLAKGVLIEAAARRK